MKNTKLLNKFINQIKRQGILSRETVQAYRSDLNQFLRLINYPVTRIDGLRIEKYYNWLQTVQNDSRTIIRKMSSLRSFYNFLLFKDLVKNNPFRYIHFAAASPFPFSGKSSPRYFRLTEVRALFHTIHHERGAFRFRNWLLFVALSRMRIGIKGCISLTLSQIDLARRNLTVVSPGQRTRVCSFSDQFQERLKLYLKVCRSPIMKRFHVHHNRLLIDYLGRPLTTRGIEYIFKQIVQVSHINRPVSINMFRHPGPLNINLIQAYRKYFIRK